MKKLILVVCACALSFAAVAQETAEKKRYTGEDFFNALDLPIVFGATYTPKGIEGVGFNTTMCLEWRWHKTYSWYVPITIDTHNSTYGRDEKHDRPNLFLDGSNIISGTVWYTDINIGAGYRIPLVKDINAFYANPYQNKLDLFLSVQPGVSVPVVKNVELVSNNPATGESQYATPDAAFSMVPTMKFTAGLEWFVDPKLCLFMEAAYVQHLTPTVIEKAAINQELIRCPNGPLLFSIGLSTFFE